MKYFEAFCRFLKSKFHHVQHWLDVGNFTWAPFAFVSLKKGKLLLFYSENLGILRGVRQVRER